MQSRRILFILTAVFCIFLLGTFGYRFIEGWSLTDSLYMTTITLSTVGFGEVQPLSQSGKLFTVLLIILGLGVVTFSITEFMTYMLSYDFKKRRREKMQKKNDELKGHTVICGFGRMGSIICKELSTSENKFIVIENDPERIVELEKTDYLWIQGDATSEETLVKAGINRAKVLVSMIDNDSDSLYISLVARSLSNSLFIICRAKDEKAKQRIARAGADKIVLPTRMTALRVAECVQNPAVEDFLDIDGVKDRVEERIQLADMYVTRDSSLVNMAIDEKGHQMSDLIIVGIKKPDKSFLFKPSSDYLFQEGDCIIAMGSKHSYKNALTEFNLRSLPVG